MTELSTYTGQDTALTRVASHNANVTELNRRTWPGKWRDNVRDDFCGSVLANGWPFSLFTNGAGSPTVSTVTVSGTQLHHGIAEITTGTGTASSAGMTSKHTACVLFGANEYEYEAIFAVPTLSDGTDTATIFCGFPNGFTGAPTNGAFFRYTHGTNSGKWQCVCIANSVETATDSGITLAAGTADANYHRYTVNINAAATSVTFYIDGTLVATVTTNVPKVTGREVGYGTLIVKSAGSTARKINLDRAEFVCIRAAAL